MKKFTNIVWCLFVLGAWTGCYEDEGHYSYHEINELEVENLEAQYERDVDDSLVISPVLKGTMYSDTSRFSYEWEIAGATIAETHDLRIKVDMTPGMKYSRFIVKDKETGVKKYSVFNLNVSSSTAGDLIMVLSKYQGRAELSYKRLDKPADWQVNYYMDRYGEALGTEPQQLTICYLEGMKSFPFVDNYGRVMVLADNNINLLYKTSLQLDTITPVLTQEAYTGLASYPKPNIEKYESQFICEYIDLWRYTAYGNAQQMVANMQISAGQLFTSVLANAIWTNNFSYSNPIPYKEGELAPFGFFDKMDDTPNDRNIQMGYDLGDFIVYDHRNCRFAFASQYGRIRDIDEKYVPAFPKYDLLWGSSTSRPNSTSLAVLNNGDQCKFVLLQHKELPRRQYTKSLVAEVQAGNTVNTRSKFYVMKYNDYMLYTTGNSLYRYNTRDIDAHRQPSQGNRLFDLTQFGYGADAEITAICVSRTEKTLLLGVSRYGSDSQADGEEAKGDILYFDLDASTMSLTYNEAKSQKGVAGIPVDIKVKYQTHFRNGIDRNGVLQDNI